MVHDSEDDPTTQSVRDMVIQWSNTETGMGKKVGLIQAIFGMGRAAYSS
jgi:hypothetical protein